MDDIDRKIAKLIQSDGRASSVEIAKAIGLSVSTANERVRKLTSSGVVREWRAVLEPKELGLNLCAMILIDVDFIGEFEATEQLKTFQEIQEIHHISGAHSYLLKVRLAGTKELQDFLHNKIKSLKAIVKSETFIVLDTLKETTELDIS